MSQPGLLERNPTLLERLSDKVLIGDGHWPWLGAKDSRGYGQIWVDGKVMGAHRVMYELLVGPIPPGWHLDHLCRDPGCTRPAHCEPVTCAENVSRSWRSTSPVCARGHQWNVVNTYVDPKGRRNCRTCRRESVRRWYESKGRAWRKRRWEEKGL